MSNKLTSRGLLPSLAGAVWLSVCCLLFAGCDNVSCPLNNSVESVYGFYAANYDDGGELITGRAVSVGDTITVTALGPDTVLVNKLINKNSVALPMSFFKDEDVLVFKFADQEQRTAYDTIWVAKSNLRHWDDPSCPIHMWHTINGVRYTHNLIDTLIITNPTVNYDGLENIQIYFRTAS